MIAPCQFQNINLMAMRRSFFIFNLIFITLIITNMLHSQNNPEIIKVPKEKVFDYVDMVNRFETIQKEEIIQEYHGIVNATRIFENGTMMSASQENYVINDQKEYKEFVGRIYPKQVTMTNPAPDSDDPLLKQPKIDFEKYSLMVMIRNDGMYGKINLFDIKRKYDPIIVTVEFPALENETMFLAQPNGLGSYLAFVIKKIDREAMFIVFK